MATLSIHAVMHRRSAAAAVGRSRWSTLIAALRRAWCRLRRHEMMLQFAPGRLSLRCASCGVETDGWSLDLPQPRRLRFPSDAAPMRRAA